MGAIDSFFDNSDLIVKGFKRLQGKVSYLIARDKYDKVLCITYDFDSGSQWITHYLEKIKQIKHEEYTIEKEVIKNKTERIEKLILYKLVLLDGVVVLYSEVLKKSKSFEIKNFTDKFPKYGINKYQTLC